MRLVSLSSPALLLAFSLFPLSARAQADDELTDEELAVAEAEAEAEAKAEEEAKAKEPPPPAAAPAEPASEAEVEEAAPADLEGIFEPGQEPFRKPPKGKGVIWGRLVDEKTGEPAIEAQISVKGTKYKILTDFDGYYRLELPPGVYTLEVFYELHEPASISGVGAAKDKISRFDAPLKPQGGALEEVVIQDEAEKQTVAGLAIARQRSASQGDAIGRAEIAKTTDSNAAEAAQRVVGANIVGGRFVYVRGLGERYSNSLLSMYPLPSPEPDRAAVPLDVFPASILDSLTIAKTFTPDMPGDFAGGSVQIETRSVPTKPIFDVSITGGINSQATFQQRLDHLSSGTDWLAMDSGMRRLPGSVPSDYPARAGSVRPDGTIIQRGDPDLVQAGRDMNSPFSARMSDTLPNHSLSVVAGDSWSLGNGQRLGFLASVNYARKYEKLTQAIMREFWLSSTDERGYETLTDYRMDRGLETIRWGSFGKLSYLISDKHKLSLTGFHSQMADDSTSVFVGSNQEVQGTFAATQLDWVERGLSFGVLSGRHEFDALNAAELSWDVSLASAYRYEPDRRDLVYKKGARVLDPDTGERGPGWTYLNKTESGRHFWAEQSELSSGGKLDWRQPLLRGDTELAVKAGGLINVKTRRFSARRFQMFPEPATFRDPAFNCAGEAFAQNCSNRLFVDENVGTLLRLDEGSQPGDAYDAVLNVYASYAMLDLEMSKKLRIVGGTRVEWTDQRIDPLFPTGGPVLIQGAELAATDALPSISLVYGATKELKTRFAYSQTLARPQLRELAPFAFSDYFGGRVTAGNPELVLTRINNLDARVEYWPSLSDVLAFTVFFKGLEDPIERVLIPAGGSPTVTFRNTPGAKVIGAEFEVRKNLGFLASALQPFSVISNFTLAWSRTEIEQTGKDTLTSLSRALTNQAPWVFNAALDYENNAGTNARVTYNVNGPTLVEVGTLGIPDGYLHPFHSLDFTVSQKFLEKWSARAMVENIVNDDVVITQGPVLTNEQISRQYTTGTIVSLGLGYSL